MAEFYKYCLPPGVHTMRLEYLIGLFIIKIKHKFFRFIMVVLILRHFWPPLSFSSLFFLCCVCLLYHAVILKLRQFLIMLK